MDRGDARGSDQQDGSKGLNGDFALVIAHRDMVLQVPGGRPMTGNGRGYDDVGAGFFRNWLRFQKP
jgi:hypothetical protein